MAIGYPWSCTFCSSGNVADADACASCGRPAIASGVDVEMAKGKLPRRSRGPIAIARDYKHGLRLFFAAVVLLFVALVAFEHFFPVNDQESFGFMILFAAMPWSVLALAIPNAFVAGILIAGGIGINAVVVAVIVLWMLGTLGFGR